MKDNHPEASQYEEYADSLTFHESKQFEADGQKVAMVDIDETICFYSGDLDFSIPHLPCNRRL